MFQLSLLISLHSVVFEDVVVESHEEDVDGDAEGDEEVGERVKHQDREELADLQPHHAAVPDAEYVDALMNDGEWLLYLNDRNEIERL